MCNPDKGSHPEHRVRIVPSSQSSCANCHKASLPATGKGREVMQAQRKTIIGCALLFLTIAGTCWWVWDTQLARHPNQLFGQLRQQGPDEKGVAKPPRRLARSRS